MLMTLLIAENANDLQALNNENQALGKKDLRLNIKPQNNDNKYDDQPLK